MPEVQGIQFDNVVNAVDDLGMDPNGNEPIDDALQGAYENGTLIEFPEGTYRVDSEAVWNGGKSNFGLRGLGDSHKDVQFTFPNADRSNEGWWFFVQDGGQNILLENFSIQMTDDDTTCISLKLEPDDGAKIIDVEWLGYVPRNQHGYGQLLRMDVTDQDGVNLARRVRMGREGTFMGGHAADTGDNPGQTYVLVYRKHVGEIRFEECHFEMCGHNTIRSIRGDGVVKVFDSYFLNNDLCALRIHNGNHPEKDSIIENCHIEMDHSKLGDLGDDPESQPYHALGILIDSYHGYPSPLIRDCDIDYRDISERTDEGGNWGVIRVTNTGASNPGALRIKNTRIRNDTNSPNIWIQDRQSGADETKNVIENVHFTFNNQSTSQGPRMIEIEDGWDDSVVRNCCLHAPEGDVDGVWVDGATNVVVEGSTINVTGEALNARSGGFRKTDYTQSGECTLPDVSKNFDDSSNGGENTFASVEGKIEKSDDDPKSAVFEKTAVGQLGSENDFYTIQGRIEKFYIDEPITIRVDGEEISGEEFIRRFVKCETVGGTSTSGSSGSDNDGGGSDNGYEFEEIDKEFDNVLNAVDDLGMDPNGDADNSDILRDAVADNTLIQFPPGTYVFDSDDAVFSDSFEKLGLEGLGESQRDVEFQFPGARNANDGYWGFRIYDSYDCMLKNFSIQSFEDEDTSVSIQFDHFDGGCVVDVEWLGFIPAQNDSRGSQLRFELHDEDGVGIVRRLTIGKQGSYLGGHESSTNNTPGSTFMRHSPNHVGELRLENVHFEQCGHNAMRSTNNDGVVTVKGGYFLNCDVSSLRFQGGDHPDKNSVIDGAHIVKDHSQLNRTGGTEPHQGQGIHIDTRVGNSGLVIKNVDIEYRDISDAPDNAGSLWGAIRLSNSGNSNAGGATVKNTRIYNQTLAPNLWFQAPKSNSKEPNEMVIENVHITSESPDSRNIDSLIHIEGRDDSVVRDCCLNAKEGDIDGVRVEDADGVSVENSTINVTGNALSGGGYSQEDYSSSGKCTLPDVLNN